MGWKYYRKPANNGARSVRFRVDPEERIYEALIFADHRLVKHERLIARANSKLRRGTDVYISDELFDWLHEMTGRQQPDPEGGNLFFMMCDEGRFYQE